MSSDSLGKTQAAKGFDTVRNVTGKFTAPAGLWLLVFFSQMGKAILCDDRVTL